VSCGAAHTLALTKIYDSLEGEGELKVSVPRGGLVYMAGIRSTLGVDCPVFTLADALKEQPCVMVSAGFGHSAAVTVYGELYAWGNNRHVLFVGIACTILHVDAEDMTL
jgi:hypothetical protein